jgi:putative hemolysin
VIGTADAGMAAEAKEIDILRLLRERSPALARRLPPGAAFLLRTVAHQQLINDIIKASQGLSPGAFCDHILRRLEISVAVENEEHLRDALRPVVCSNHPTGGVEGLALISTLLRVRGACRVPANDLLCLVSPLAPVLVPVNRGNPTRDGMNAFLRAFGGDDPILVFPAGVTARMRGGILREYPWESAFLTHARRTGRDILPVWVSGMNSSHFYLIHRLRRVLGLSVNLEMALLVDELLRRKGETVVLRFLPGRAAWGAGQAEDRRQCEAIQKEVCP